jgi:hypothetical protein
MYFSLGFVWSSRRRFFESTGRVVTIVSQCSANARGNSLAGPVKRCPDAIFRNISRVNLNHCGTVLTLQSPEWRPNRNVWSAVLSQAKNESDRMVCANVFGLCWSIKLLALMECAARSSYLVIQPWKAFPVYRFRERRVRPLCHLIVRQQSWQKIINSVVAAGR